MKSLPGKVVRVPISPPAIDETFSSVLDRAAVFWGLDRETMISALVPYEASAAHAAEADSPTPALVSAFAAAIGAPPDLVLSTSIENESSTIAPGFRVAYCPLCWDDDKNAGRDPYFRRVWCAMDAILCAVHRIPLDAWATNTLGRRLPPPSACCESKRADELWLNGLDRARRWESDRNADVMRTIVVATAGFSANAVAALSNSKMDRCDWRGGRDAIERVGLLLATNPAPYAEHLPMDRLVPDVACGYLFSGNRRAAAPSTMEEGWEAVRRLGEPALRRTFWWLIARTVADEWQPLPIRRWAGACSGLESWWYRRVQPALNGHGLQVARDLERCLNISREGETEDLFAA